MKTIKKLLVTALLCALIVSALPFSAAAASYPVTVYDGLNYSGFGVSFDVNSYYTYTTEQQYKDQAIYISAIASGYTVAQANQMAVRYRYFKSIQGIDNGIDINTIRSVKVTPGYTVTLYENENCTGNSVTLTSDTPNLGTYNFDKKTKSLKVTAIPVQPVQVPHIIYFANVAGIGWVTTAFITGNLGVSGGIAGTTGQSRAIEALRVISSDPNNLTVQVSANVQNIGWLPFTSDGSGTTGQSLRTEAYKMYLTGSLASKYSIEYRSYIQNIGWTDWVRDGAISGTTGQSLRLEAIEIRLVAKYSSTEVPYQLVK